jgi:xanthine/uracil permease
MFLILMGIFSKFAAALVAIPSAVIGGMTTFLFCAGMSIFHIHTTLLKMQLLTYFRI